MKAQEIQVGREYVAKVNDTLTTVRVLRIRESSHTKGGKLYDVVNVRTNRETTFRSASKFREEKRPAPKRGELVTINDGKASYLVQDVLPNGFIRLTGLPKPISPHLLRVVTGEVEPAPQRPKPVLAKGNIPIREVPKPSGWQPECSPQEAEVNYRTLTPEEAVEEMRGVTVAGEKPEGEKSLPPSRTAGAPNNGSSMKPSGQSALSVGSATPAGSSSKSLGNFPTAVVGETCPPWTTPDKLAQAKECVAVTRRMLELVEEGQDKAENWPELWKTMEEVSKWYLKALSKMKRLGIGDEDTPKELGESLLALHQNATLVNIVNRRRQKKAEEALAAPKSGLGAHLAAKPVVKAPTGPKHMIVTARAGTGKTTTLIGGVKKIKGLDPGIKPSDQQAAIWEEMMRTKDSRAMAIVCFNNAIAAELKSKVPPGCKAMTNHSMGSLAVRHNFRLRGGEKGDGINDYRVQDIICEILRRDVKELRSEQSVLLQGTTRLVGFCKQNLVGYEKGNPQAAFSEEYWWENLTELADHYDVELKEEGEDGRDYTEDIFRLVPLVLDRCKDVAKDGCIDFDDMIWLPVVLDLPIYVNDLLLVDEAQDLNRCQQALIRKAGKRIVLCGDPKQAIYGFAGADVESMPRMFTELGNTDRGVADFPLNVTRRCAKSIVAEAQKLVPDFYAHEGNGEGRVLKAYYDKRDVPQMTVNDLHSGYYQDFAKDGDMVLCRVNAPLVSQCFQFIKQGRKANIQGRDIGKGIVEQIQRFNAASVEDLIGAVDQWVFNEQRKENAKRNPSESRLIAITDKGECIKAFTEGVDTVEKVLARVTTIFTDENQKEGIRLSSIHKAKGLEADRVFFLTPKGAECPHPMAKSAWQQEQERNLRYVAVTRAKNELVYVS